MSGSSDPVGPKQKLIAQVKINFASCCAILIAIVKELSMMATGKIMRRELSD